MMLLFLAIHLLTLREPFKKIEIKSSSGDVRVKIASIEKLRLPDNVKLEKKASGLFIHCDYGDNIFSIPDTVETLVVSSSSGDIYVTGEKAGLLEVRSEYGDINIRIGHANELNVNSQSGSIYVKQEKCGKTRVESSTGDIVYYGPACDSLWIFSSSGDIDLFVFGRLSAHPNVRSLYGDVTIYNIETGEVKTLRREEKEQRISHTTEPLNGYIPFHSWKRFPLEYTRVDGFVLNVPFENQKGRDFYQGYVGYSFGGKRVDFYIDGRKTTNHFGIYFRGYSERRSRDAIFLSDNEESIASLFLHSSFADYYHGSGFGLFGSVVFKRLWLRVGYEREIIKSLKKVSDWSLFYRSSRMFPENPPVFEGSVEFQKLETGYRTENLSFRLDLMKQIGSDYPYFTKAAGILRGKIRVTGFEIYPAMIAQYSTDSLVAPFDFYLGGPFTLPGYRWKEFHGSRWMYLGNLFCKFTILDQTFFLRFDIGQTDETSEPKMDIGVGAYMEEWYIGVASPVDGKDYKLFGGLSWRFKW